MCADVVIVGAGPVGLWTAIQLKKRDPNLEVQLYERYSEYQRSHVLRLEHFSMLAYCKTSRDKREREFFEEVTKKNLGQVFNVAASLFGTSVFIRTNDLERALKNYASSLGVKLTLQAIESPEEIALQHPECSTFIAADGAHSKMRNTILGEDSKQEYPLQHVVEIKYEAEGKTQPLSFHEQYKTNKILSNMAFEYVGKEKNGKTPVTLRFFVDEATYKAIPTASFKEPLRLNDRRLSWALAHDIQTYMNVRKVEANETFLEGSDKASKLILSMYAAKKFATEYKGKNWFFVGDAAMGVPYFRALNSGLIIGSQLGFILTRKRISGKTKIKSFNACRPLDIAWEFATARGKNLALTAYNAFRRKRASAPLQSVRWCNDEIENFQTTSHRAFRPGDMPHP